MRKEGADVLIVARYRGLCIVAIRRGSSVAAYPLGLEAISPERIHAKSAVERVEGEVAVLP